jgi:hypothetical protein
LARPIAARAGRSDCGWPSRIRNGLQTALQAAHQAGASYKACSDSSPASPDNASADSSPDAETEHAAAGHADPSITLRVYAHLMADGLTEAAALYDQLRTLVVDAR